MSDHSPATTSPDPRPSEPSSLPAEGPSSENAPASETVPQQISEPTGGGEPESTAPSAGELADGLTGDSAWLQRSDQWVVAAVCVVLLGWSGLRWLELSHWGQQEIEIARQPAQEYGYVLNLNTANWVELALLEGVGEVLGKRIVADREAQGPFTSLDDLRRVTGIGAKTLEKLRPHLYVEPQP